MQLFAGSRNAVRFVKLVVSTISACFAMCYRVPLPQTLVCVSLELPACGDLRRARQHTALHACMCLVLTCTPENMRARASCWRARRRTCVHESCAGLHAGEHACTSLVLACTLVNMCARVSCWHTRQGTCLDVARADLHRFVYPLITVISISMFSSRWTSAKRSRSWLIFVRTGTASSASS